MDREIPIILDDLADPEFGTGVVKVTPAHDLNDFEAGRRHNLPKVKVIDENGVMTAAGGPAAPVMPVARRRPRQPQPCCRRLPPR
jgi:valyl-tRNA synthetase